jgi:hypothetical protein
MSENGIDTVIFFDIMGNKNLIGEPRWLIDAWSKSIVAPLTRLAEMGLDDFKMRREDNNQEREIWEMDALMDLAEPDPEQFKLRCDLHRKIREFRKLKDLERLPRYSRRDNEVFEEKFDAYIKRYKRSGTKNPDALVLRNQKKLEREIRDMEPKIKPLKSGSPPTAGSAQQPDDDGEFDRTELLRMPFRKKIRPEDWPEVLDWSHSNMSKLFDIGVETGKAFYEEHKARLISSMEKDADPA